MCHTDPSTTLLSCCCCCCCFCRCCLPCCCCHCRGNVITHRLNKHARAGLPHLPGHPGLGRCHRPGLLHRLQRPAHCRAHARLLQPTLVRACVRACVLPAVLLNCCLALNRTQQHSATTHRATGTLCGGPKLGPLQAQFGGRVQGTPLWGVGEEGQRYLHCINRCLLPTAHHMQVLPHTPHRPPGRSKPAAEDPWERRCTDLRRQRQQQHSRHGNGGYVCSRI